MLPDELLLRVALKAEVDPEPRVAPAALPPRFVVERATALRVAVLHDVHVAHRGVAEQLQQVLTDVLRVSEAVLINEQRLDKTHDITAPILFMESHQSLIELMRRKW